MSTEGEAPAGPAEADGGGRASRRVEAIIVAAEQAADELRTNAERRSIERIAEADRAAENRVTAAEAEAAEIVAEAQRRAAALHETAESAVARIRAEAEAQAAKIIDNAQTEATETQRIAEVFAAETRDSADREAREHGRRAREAAGDVLAEGEEISGNLRALGDSLHTNADRLLRDVVTAHRGFIASLERAGVPLPENGSSPSPASRPEPARAGAAFGEIPEFIPDRPRRQG